MAKISGWVRRRVWYSGQVQGVGFRQTVQQIAAGQGGVALLWSVAATLGIAGSGAIAAGMPRVAQSVQISAEQAAQQALPEQKVLIQHSVPRVMTDLVRSQFHLLYDGLRPVLEASAVNSTQLQNLRASIDDCLQRYRDLQVEIEQATQHAAPDLEVDSAPPSTVSPTSKKRKR